MRVIRQTSLTKRGHERSPDEWVFPDRPGYWGVCRYRRGPGPLRSLTLRVGWAYADPTPRVRLRYRSRTTPPQNPGRSEFFKDLIRILPSEEGHADCSWSDVPLLQGPCPCGSHSSSQAPR